MLDMREKERELGRWRESEGDDEGERGINERDVEKISFITLSRYLL